MGFFSTADRSPKPGQTGVDLLRNFQTSRQIGVTEDKQELEQDKFDNKIQTAALKQAREQKLYSTFRDLQSIDSPTVQQWQRDNKVTASEWKQFTPFIEQIEKDKQKVRYDQIARTLYNTKDLSPETVKKVYQQYNVTPDEHKNLNSIVEDLRSEKKFVTTEADGYKIKTNTRTGEQTAVHKLDDGTGNTKAERTSESVKLATTYLKPLHNVGGMMPNEINAEKAAAYQEDVNFMLTRIDALVSDPNNNLSTAEEAFPAVVKEYNQRGVWSLQAAQGFSETQGDERDTVNQIKRMSDVGMPLDVTLSGLKKSGWTSEQINGMLEQAAFEVDPAKAGVNIKLLKRRMPKQGQGVSIKGQIWIRRGNHIVNDQVHPPQMIRISDE